MSIVEYEHWEIAKGNEEQHHEMIRKWFQFVAESHADLFEEWKSAKYYRQIDREGNQTGRYIMLFEFHSLEGHHAYKERRKDWSGPYEEYKTVDPYEFFNHDTVTLDFWEPQEEQLWFEFPDAKSDH